MKGFFKPFNNYYLDRGKTTSAQEPKRGDCLRGMTYSSEWKPLMSATVYRVFNLPAAGVVRSSSWDS